MNVNDGKMNAEKIRHSFENPCAARIGSLDRELRGRVERQAGRAA